ncbi:MAG: hypothetical protein NC203_12085 [Firmicutes bacterium]|nr:hypothetical protein [Bacillota bacterium]
MLQTLYARTVYSEMRDGVLKTAAAIEKMNTGFWDSLLYMNTAKITKDKINEVIL